MQMVARRWLQWLPAPDDWAIIITIIMVSFKRPVVMSTTSWMKGEKTIEADEGKKTGRNLSWWREMMHTLETNRERARVSFFER